MFFQCLPITSQPLKSNPDTNHLRHRTTSTPSPHRHVKKSKNYSDENHVRLFPEANNLAPRGRSVPHSSSTTHALTQTAPNPVPSSWKTRPSSSPPLPRSTFIHPKNMPLIDPRLSNDPAFSTDPRSNPHYSMHISSYGAHFSQPAPTRPTGRRLSHAEVDGDFDQHRLRRPSNSPQDAPEYRGSDRTSYAPFQPVHASIPSTPPLSSTPSTTSPASSPSPTPSTPPADATLSNPNPVTSRAEPPDLSHDSQSFPLREALFHNHTTPDLRYGVRKPSLPPRPLTSPGNSRTRGGFDNPRNRSTPHLAPRNTQLDRIDELDETDPLGMPWHHGGPYEAIYKVTRDRAYQAQLEKLDSVEDHHRNIDMQRKSRKAPQFTPEGIATFSLDLVPGQILPRMPEYDSRAPIPPHPLLRKIPYDNSADDRALNKMNAFSPDILPPIYPQAVAPDHEPIPKSSRPYHEYHVRSDDRHASAPPLLINQNPSTDHDHIKKRAPAKLVRPRKERHDRHRRDSDPANPQRAVEWAVRPAHNAEPWSQDNLGHAAQLKDGDPRPVIPAHPSQSRSRRSVHYATDTVNRTRDAKIPTERENDGPRDAPADPETTYRPSRVHSNAPSVKPSSHGPASSRYRNDAPKPLHLPTRLVMPTPLQVQHTSADGPRATMHLDQHSSRSKPRAREIPMQPESRKLVRRRAEALHHGTLDHVFSIPPAARAGDIDMHVAHRLPTSNYHHHHHDALAKRMLSKRRIEV